MFVFSKIISIIKSQDINGTIINFHFLENSNKHKSICGGFLSIVSVISIIYFGFSKFILVINRENTSNGSNV